MMGSSTARALSLIAAALFWTACSTLTYKSAGSPSVVSECIAKRWENAGASGFKVPIELTEMEDGYFVGFNVPVLILPFPLGLKHPTYSVWAEVHKAASGSETEYHRALQFTHERIDRAVQECQEQGEGPR
jgi:hypothetical protein